MIPEPTVDGPTAVPEAAVPVIEVTDLFKEYNGRAVTNGVSFKVFAGDTMIIMGGSGCGKSTLLRQVIGSVKPTSGSIKIFGHEITTMDETELAKVRRRFGVLFQSGALLQSLTVGENVALPILEHSTVGDNIVELILSKKAVIDENRMESFADRRELFRSEQYI